VERGLARTDLQHAVAGPDPQPVEEGERNGVPEPRLHSKAGGLTPRVAEQIPILHDEGCRDRKRAAIRFLRPKPQPSRTPVAEEIHEHVPALVLEDARDRFETVVHRESADVEQRA
jgi:hypothetical protein